MNNYVAEFVSGHGITFPKSRQNREAFERASEKWKAISHDIGVSRESIVMFCGAKSNGKSNLVRYILNQYLFDDADGFSDIDSDDRDTRLVSGQRNSTRKAFYVDFDPGQPEMSTPGTVSSHIISSTDPILTGPTYLNVLKHEQVAMSSIGGLQMSVNPKFYIENCRLIFEQTINRRNEESEKHPIFINTMGHIRNIGLALLMDLIKITQLTDLVILNVVNDPMRTIYANLTPECMTNTRASFYYETHDQFKTKLDYKCHLYNLEFSFSQSQSVATNNRIALQLAYLSSIPDAIYKPVMQITPKLLAMDSVYFHCVSTYPLKVGIVIELLHHSWVHLVKLRRVPRSILTEGQEPLCKIIDEVGENYMIGCGIITQIDLEAKTLSIITPLNDEELKRKVDCVIKPLSVQVPREIMQDAI